MRDLLDLPAPSTPPTTPPGTDPSCGRHRFAYSPPSAARSVHVAGSFNGWSPTAWPMTWVEGVREWQSERELPDGTYQYKFVVDGSQWVSDPRATASMPDGFGGQNSVLTLRCADAGAPAPAPPGGVDPVEEATRSLPVESRPQGFAFDDNADTALVTSVHVNEYLRAGRSLTAAVSSRLRAVVGCEASADRAACANTLVRGFGTRVFRRPLSAAEMQRYGALVTGRATSTRECPGRCGRCCSRRPSSTARRWALLSPTEPSVSPPTRSRPRSRTPTGEAPPTRPSSPPPPTALSPPPPEPSARPDASSPTPAPGRSSPPSRSSGSAWRPSPPRPGAPRCFRPSPTRCAPRCSKRPAAS
ncbi:MAG: DUF1595 domain-containing protein [Deltaproteobacteria bacterium]|nr:DUF1595 domain-containing protein [Deltaproteobacteria bacterium]